MVVQDLERQVAQLEADVKVVEMDSQAWDKAVRFLQYEVRERREAGEPCCEVVAGIANCNGSCLLRFLLCGGG